jgi:hypothetical protein
MKRGTPVVSRTAELEFNDSKPVQSQDHLFSQIIDSETFKGAPVMRALLLFLWRSQGQVLSEYAIAIDALGRPPDFDPKADATVRVSIARLRRKLNEYYQKEAEAVPLRLTIPLGGHGLEWKQNSEVPSRWANFKGLPVFYRNLLAGSAVLVAILTVLGAVLVRENHTLRASRATRNAPLPRLWRSFLVGGKEPLIVIPTPSFFWWEDSHILIRDGAVSEFEGWMSSPYIRQVAAKLGPPVLSQNYLTVKAAKSAAKMLAYLEGFGQRPDLTDTGNLPAESYSSRNTVFLGSMRQYAAGDRVLQIMKNMNFYVQGSEPATVWNRNPRPGELGSYKEISFSADHKVVPVVVSLLPQTGNGTRSLVLLGANANTFVFNSLLLSDEGLAILDEQWRKAGSPDSWEMLVQAEINNDTVLKLRPVATRVIPPSFWTNYASGMSERHQSQPATNH